MGQAETHDANNPSVESEVEARVSERPDLLDRIQKGDPLAIAEMLEHATGATARSVKVTAPRPGGPEADG
ncbi:MAG: hypothetical protein ACRD2W_02295 [Acidimicrobiales bacterium]